MELEKQRAELAGAGIDLVAISYDSPEVLRAFGAERGIAFALLSDPGSRTIDAYGVRNAAASGRTAGIPHPGFFVLDETGTIRAKLFEASYRDRPSPAALIEAVAKLRAP